MMKFGNMRKTKKNKKIKTKTGTVKMGRLWKWNVIVQYFLLFLSVVYFYFLKNFLRSFFLYSFIVHFFFRLHVFFFFFYFFFLILKKVIYRILLALVFVYLFFPHTFRLSSQ